jgi:hypothetical protein
MVFTILSPCASRYCACLASAFPAAPSAVRQQYQHPALPIGHTAASTRGRHSCFAGRHASIQGLHQVCLQAIALGRLCHAAGWPKEGLLLAEQVLTVLRHEKSRAGNRVGAKSVGWGQGIKLATLDGASSSSRAANFPWRRVTQRHLAAVATRWVVRGSWIRTS